MWDTSHGSALRDTLYSGAALWSSTLSLQSPSSHNLPNRGHSHYHHSPAAMFTAEGTVTLYHHLPTSVYPAEGTATLYHHSPVTIYPIKGTLILPSLTGYKNTPEEAHTLLVPSITAFYLCSKGSSHIVPSLTSLYLQQRALLLYHHSPVAMYTAEGTLILQPAYQNILARKIKYNTGIHCYDKLLTPMLVLLISCPPPLFTNISVVSSSF